MFNRIIIHNFLSWGSLDYTFTEGVTLLTGVNNDDSRPEGAGKTSILNALCWCLYGKIPKDNYSINDLIKEGETTCSVRVKLNNGTYIDRSRNPNDLCIRYPNVHEGETVRGKDLRETQKLVDNIIGISFDTFCQTVYLPQNYSKKFISSSESEKAKILSEVQDLSVFDRARKKASDEYKNLELKLEKYKITYSSLQNQINTDRNRLEELSKLKDSFNKDKKERINSLQKSLESIKSELLEEENKAINLSRDKELIILLNNDTKYDIDHIIEDTEKEIESISKNLLGIQLNKKRCIDLKSKLEELNERINNITNSYSNSPENCSKCGASFIQSPELLRKYEDTAKIEVNNLTKQADSTQKELASLLVLDDSKNIQSKLEDLRIKKKKLLMSKESAYSKKYVFESYKMRATQLRESVTLYENMIAEESKKTSEELVHYIKNLKEQIDKNFLIYEDLNNKIISIQDKLNRITVLKGTFKEVKSHVFNNFLNRLTLKSNEYAAELFTQPVKIKFTALDEDGEASKISVDVKLGGSDSRPLGLFSGGQFKRLQLAVDLALSNLITHNSDNPIMFRAMDEYFNGLSEVSMEQVLRLLQDQKGTTILIEHNSIFKNIVNNTLNIELSHGESRIV